MRSKWDLSSSFRYFKYKIISISLTMKALIKFNFNKIMEVKTINCSNMNVMILWSHLEKIMEWSLKASLAVKMVHSVSDGNLKNC
jgi:hypothetical protein